MSPPKPVDQDDDRITPQERAAALARMPLEVVGSHQGLLGGTPQSVQQIWHYRHLLLLTRREIKVRYKDSVFGLLSSLIRPLAMLIVYYVASTRRWATSFPTAARTFLHASALQRRGGSTGASNHACLGGAACGRRAGSRPLLRRRPPTSSCLLAERAGGRVTLHEVASA